MTNGKHDAHPRWSPDGKRIAFVAGERKTTAQASPRAGAILSLAGGELARHRSAEGRSRFIWSPDSKRIAFMSSTTPEDVEKRTTQEE